MGLSVASPRLPRQRVLIALAGGYVGAVAGAALLRGLTGVPHATDLASTPADIAQGRLWTLVTSAFVVSGPAMPEIAGLVLVGVAIVRRHGAGVFWRAAAVGHLGSAALAYAGLGLLTIAGEHLANRTVHDPDYGVSCVWAGLAGALAVSIARSLRRRPNHVAMTALAVSYTTLVVLGLLVGSPLVRVEHLLALGLGSAVMVRSRP